MFSVGGNSDDVHDVELDTFHRPQRRSLCQSTVAIKSCETVASHYAVKAPHHAAGSRLRSRVVARRRPAGSAQGQPSPHPHMSKPVLTFRSSLVYWSRSLLGPCMSDSRQRVPISRTGSRSPSRPLSSSASWAMWEHSCISWSPAWAHISWSSGHEAELCHGWSSCELSSRLSESKRLIRGSWVMGHLLYK